MTTVLQFIISIAALIFIHELGHYIGAKIAGIQIEEFGIGFPPKITKLFTFQGTEFTLNWIPLGGFVRAKGEEGLTDAGGEDYFNASPFKRLIFLFFGPLFNLLTAVILFTFIYANIGLDLNSVQIADIAANSPAQQVGLQVGDIIEYVNGIEIKSYETIQELTQASLDTPMNLIVLREGQEVELTVTPRSNPPEGEGAMGISMSNPIGADIPLGQAIKSGFIATGERIKAMFDMVKMIFTRSMPDEARVVGYKGMYDMYNLNREMDASMPEYGRANTLAFIAFISVSLGIMNLLPIPALDGGRILFTIPEWLFKKKIPLNVQNVLNAVFFFLLIALMFIVNIQDFTNPINF